MTSEARIIKDLLQHAQCPKCGRESLVDSETGEYLYHETVGRFKGRRVECDWGYGCDGDWQIPS